MKKTNNKGFMLAETLVVSTLIATILIYLYIQFMNIYNNYQDSFDYNTVDGLYAASNIREFLLTDNIEEIISDTDLTNNYYVDLINYNNYTEPTYINNMFQFLDIQEAILTNENLNDLKNNIGDFNFSIGLKDFIKYTKSDGDEDVYRLFIVYGNNTYASIKVSMEE